MGVFKDLLGTTQAFFRIGLTGPRLKNSSGALHVRDAADTVFVDMIVDTLRAAGVEVEANDIILNADAAGSGADWTLTLSRPATGMTHNIQVVMPSGDPSVGQALTVASFAGDVITLQYSTVAGGTDKVISDTTSLAFGASSPVAMFTLPANAIVKQVQVIIDTAFNGAPSLSIGIAGTTSKYMGATQVDLTAAAGTIFEVAPGVIAAGGTENLIATYAAGAASAGACRILVDYVIPS